MTQEARIIKLLTPYLMAFPQSRMNEGGLIVYAKALRSLSLEQIEAAMNKLLRTMKFFPSVAEIVSEAESVTRYINGTEDKMPDEAWSEVVRQMQKAFVYRKPQFSTPEIERAALAMGWDALCQVHTEGMNTARSQFVKFYEGVLKRKREAKANEDVVAMMPTEKVQALMQRMGAKLSLVSGGGRK